MINQGKPSTVASGCAWGIIGAPLLFLGGGYILKIIVGCFGY